MRKLRALWRWGRVLCVPGLAALAFAAHATVSSAASSLSVSSSIRTGQTLSGNVRWSASAGGISWRRMARVEFSIDGARRSTDPALPYFFNGDYGYLDTTALSDGTHTLAVRAVAKDGRIASSSAIVTVRNAPVNTASPAVSGEAQVGKTLTASPGSWTSSLPMAVSYQWQRCDSTGVSCADVAAAVARTYTPTPSDVDAALRIKVAAVNAAGSATAFSTATPAVAAAPSPATSPPSASAARYGVHMDLTWDGYAWRRQLAIDKAANFLHAQISRNSFLWHLIEPGKGVRDWSRTDAVVNDLLAKGIEPLFVVYGSPSWANGASTSTSNYYLYVPTTEPAFTSWLAAYTDFVKAAVQRYKGKVEKWEIWNEENEHYFWKPGPNLDQYARFFTAVRSAILSVDPSAQVAVGGLAGLCCSGVGDINGLEFLTGLVARDVAFDNVAIHPYAGKQQAPDVYLRYQNNFDDIAMIRSYLISVGRPVPLWATEWGWKSADIGVDLQAKYVAKSIQMLKEQYPYVTVATLFIDRDRPTYSQGLFDSSFNPKPAAYAFAQSMTAG